MRIRKLFHSLLLLICMLTVFSFSAYATETTETEATAKQEVYRKKISGKNYLFYKDTGKKVTGITGVQEVPKGSGDYYYFRNSQGRIYVKQWFSKNKKYYYADANGKLKSGWQTIGKKTYYFNTKTFTRTTGWKKISKKYYYFNSKGVQITKWLKLNGKTYYLDPDAKGARVTGWKTIDKKVYYFNSSGKLQTGLITVDGKTYYCNKSGVRKTGLITINGKRYYFDKKDNGAMKTGWVTVNNKTYYMSNVKSKKGQAVTGWMQKGGYYYYFNSKGVMQKGWLTQSGRKYYLDPTTGQMLTGKQTISGKTYDFGTKGYIVTEVTGTWSIKVNRKTNVVTIYRGSTPIKAFLCSVGLYGATPTGTRYVVTKLRWHELNGGVWGQYCCHLSTSPSVKWSSYLFHSVPYNRAYDPKSLSAANYNKLGSAASSGCIRLNVASAKYIYDYVPLGTKVTIFDGTSANDPLGKPTLAKIPSSQTWDPTDPNI